MNLKLKNQLKVASDYRRKRETYDSLLTPCLTITVALVLVAVVVMFNNPSHTVAWGVGLVAIGANLLVVIPLALLGTRAEKRYHAAVATARRTMNEDRHIRTVWGTSDRRSGDAS